MQFLIALIFALCSFTLAYRNGFDGFKDDVKCLWGYCPSSQMKLVRKNAEMYLEMAEETASEARFAFQTVDPNNHFSVARAKTAYKKLCNFSVFLRFGGGYGKVRYFQKTMERIHKMDAQFNTLAGSWYALVQNADGQLGKPKTCEEVQKEQAKKN